MRFRTLIGFGIGYVLGARSDTKRYDDLQQLYQSVTHSPIFQAMLQQARQAAASGMQNLTGQQPSWAPGGGGGNGGQARQKSGQGQQAESSQQSEGSEEESQQQEQEAKSGNGGGKGKQQAKQQSGQSSS